MTIRLSNDPGEWEATFDALLAHLCRDLLLDGPIRVVVTVNVDGEAQPDLREGVMVKFNRPPEGGTLDFDDGHSIAWDDIIGIEVP